MSDAGEEPQLPDTSGRPLDQVFAELARRAGALAARYNAAGKDLTALFKDLATGLDRTAGRLSDALSERQLRPPAADPDALVRRLAQGGPSALSAREQRLLVVTPSHLTALQLDALLAHSPRLLRHAARACFQHWTDYVAQPWGAAYQSVLLARAETSGFEFLPDCRLAPRVLLSRGQQPGHVALAKTLPTSDIVEAYDCVRRRYGVRDTWALCPSVLTAWLEDRHARGVSLESTLQQIWRHDRLPSLLLPRPRDGAPNVTVRTCVDLHARNVVSLLAAAFSSPARLSRSALASLTEGLLKSTFDDPRASLRSEGWNTVSRLDDHSFRQLLGSLIEQDLDVFFRHAMHEPKRQRFWLQYLHCIERTGCVLDRDERARLEAKLQDKPELHSALTRAHAFRSRSSVQAFYLVFADLVAVEFSHMGNAMYIYEREWFEETLEPRIRSTATTGVSALKCRGAAVGRIEHNGAWERFTVTWLSTRGVHARPREAGGPLTP